MQRFAWRIDLAFIRCKPAFGNDDEDANRVVRAVLTPFRPANVWPTGLFIEEELV